MDNNPLNQDLTNLTVAKNYKLVKKLGAGAFGEIYLGVNKQNKEQFAIKLERGDTKHPQIFFEAKLYTYLQSSELDDKGIPRIYGQGTDGQFNYMVMDLLGQSLEDLFSKYNRTFSLKTVDKYQNNQVLMMGDQMIQRIEFIHLKQFLHRDIKPDNFLIGYGDQAHQVYIVDFGLAKRYQTREGHIAYKEGKSLTGTARYASINTHMGFEQSRRDDLESLGYVLLYFLRGSLPWQNMKAVNQKDKYQKIMEKKIETSSEVLCRGFPSEFVQYMTYCKNLKFDDKPDYKFLKGLFKEAMRKAGYEMDFKYDWVENKHYSSLKDDLGLSVASPTQRIIVVPQKTIRYDQKNGTTQVGSKLPLLNQPITSFYVNQRHNKLPNHKGSNDKIAGKSQQKIQTSQRNYYVQNPLNKLPQTRVITLKEMYRKT